jgi:hypothetical protein
MRTSDRAILEKVLLKLEVLPQIFKCGIPIHDVPVSLVPLLGQERRHCCRLGEEIINLGICYGIPFSRVHDHLNLEQTCHKGPGLLNELVVVAIIEDLLISIEVSKKADTLNHIWRILQILWWQMIIDGHLYWYSHHYLRRRNYCRWNHLLLDQNLLR